MTLMTIDLVGWGTMLYFLQYLRLMQLRCGLHRSDGCFYWMCKSPQTLIVVKSRKFILTIAFLYSVIYSVVNDVQYFPDPQIMLVVLNLYESDTHVSHIHIIHMCMNEWDLYICNILVFCWKFPFQFKAIMTPCGPECISISSKLCKCILSANR